MVLPELRHCSSNPRAASRRGGQVAEGADGGGVVAWCGLDEVVEREVALDRTTHAPHLVDVEKLMPGRSTPGRPGAATPRLRTVAYGTFAWVVVFDAFHVYWALGGRFGFGDQIDPLPSNPTAWAQVLGAVVLALFILGTTLPLAIARRWDRWIPRWTVLTMAWAAAALLIARAVTAFVDDAMRTFLGSTTGLSGLTYQQLLGTAHPSQYTLWSARTIDLYFFLGGLLYAAMAWLARARHPAAEQAPK